jgi:hypothetical protein
MASGEISTVVPEGGGAGTAIPWIGGGSVRGSTRRGSGVAPGGLMSRSLREFSGSLRANWELLGGQDNPLARSSVSRREDAQDDEEALKWAALESLPTYDRLRTSVFFNSDTGNKDPVDVRLLTAADRRQLLDSLLKSSEDENQQILVKMRNRLQKYGRKSDFVFLLLLLLLVTFLKFIGEVFFLFLLFSSSLRIFEEERRRNFLSNFLKFLEEDQDLHCQALALLET